MRPLLGARLILPGFVNQSDLGRYFAAADIFVLPTAYDTWGLVVNEAMHWGLPCIVSDRTGTRHDLVVDGITGFIHAWNSQENLAGIMRKFLDNPASPPHSAKIPTNKSTASAPMSSSTASIQP